MDERQREFLQALVDCGLSMGTLASVGTVIKTEATRKYMAKKIIEAEDNGEKITDQLVLGILVDMMKMVKPE